MLKTPYRDKYRKNRKNNKSNKNQDLGRVEAKKGLEMSSNVAKNGKVTRIFVASQKTHGKYGKNTNLTRIKT